MTSTEDFLDLVKIITHQGIIASLDVESLFSNLPIDETIKLIIDRTFNHPNLPPPKIPPEILKKMLTLCIRELPLIASNGYLQ